jgi:hypothetical protein
MRLYLMPNKPTNKTRPWVSERIPFARRVDNSKFYNARKWRKISKLKRTLNPICECDECTELGRVLSSDVADHTRGLQFLLDHNLDPYDLNELKSMNHKCHNQKSGRDSHKNRGDGSNHQ